VTIDRKLVRYCGGFFGVFQTTEKTSERLLPNE
jgi:hypothetical protein